MKKILFILFLFLAVSAFAVEYPPTLVELLQSYADKGTELVITTNCVVGGFHPGKVLAVLEDYIIFRDDNEGVMIINIKNIAIIMGK